jgi:t-SNARE complex subunit (syntaxin)
VLVKKFTDALSAFRETESGIQAKNRELLVRRFQIVQPELPEPVIAAAVDAEPGDLATLPQLNVFAMAAGGANVEELERKLEHLHAQRRSMMRLEKSILVLNGLILDMHRLVLAQGDSLHSIAVYAERTVEYQKATHVDQAVEYQKNIRKLRCAIL